MTQSPQQRYEALKSMLLLRKKSIEAEQRSSEQEVRSRIGRTLSLTAWAQSMRNKQDQDIEYTLIQQCERNLKLIEKALAELEVGIYGICKRCLEPIEQSRLRALLYTELCGNCADTADFAQQHDQAKQKDEKARVKQNTKPGQMKL